MKKYFWAFILFFLLSVLSGLAHADNDLVSLKLTNGPLRAAFQKISDQTNFTFVYGNSIIDNISVTCDYEMAPCMVVLRELLSPNRLSFRLTDHNQIVIFKDKKNRQKHLSGYIIDKDTSEPLPYANIIFPGTNRGTSSNREGYFVLLNLPDKDANIEVQYIGYRTKRLVVDSSLFSKKQVIVKLEQNPIRMDQVVYEINKSEILQVSDEIGKIAISPYRISDLPYIGDKDLTRALQFMPGISASNFSSSGLNIRGGLPSQNLILLDGIKLYHINHVFGFFSAFNSDAIKDTRVYRSNFPTRYGERLSGVIDMAVKNGDVKHIRLSTTMSQAISGAVLELPLFSKGSVLVSFRRSYSDIFFGPLHDRVQRTLYKKKAVADKQIMLDDSIQVINSESNLNFYDALGKLTFLPSSKDLLTFSFYKGQDQLKSSEQIVADEAWKTSESKWGNNGYSFKWYRQQNKKYGLSCLLTFSDYFTQYNLLDDIAGFYPVWGGDPADTFFVAASEIANNIEDISFRFDNQWQLLHGHYWEYGIAYSRTKILFDTRKLYSNMAAFFPDDQESKETSDLYSLYFNDSWNCRDDLKVLGGIRVNRFRDLKDVDWEPRLSANYHLNSKTILKAAWGQYYQYILQYGDGSQTLDGRISWVSANDTDLPRASAKQMVLGAQYETKQFLLNIEGYHKHLQGLLDSFNDWQYENSGDFSQFVDNRVTGFDIIAQKKAGRINGWISYGYCNSINYSNVDDKSYLSSQNSPHNINIVANYIYKNWRLSAAWQYASGRPYSVPELKKYKSDRTQLDFYYFYPPNERNTKRLPPSHQLDISLSCYLKYSFVKGKIGVSVFDVYNQKNTWYRDYTMDQGRLNEINVRMFGTTPTFFLQLQL